MCVWGAGRGGGVNASLYEDVCAALRETLQRGRGGEGIVRYGKNGSKKRDLFPQSGEQGN